MQNRETDTMLADLNTHKHDLQETTRVLIIDDHNLFRKGIRLLLENRHNIEVVGEAEDGSSGLELYSAVKPDVVLLDMNLPDAYGYEVARKLKEQDASVRIVVLSALYCEELLREALQSGVHGFILKNADNEELVTAICRARKAQRHLCPETLQEVVDAFIKASFAAHDLSLTQMTQREREIFDLVAQDYKNKAIAEKCYISVKTVEKHKSNIIRKLQLANAAELRSFAITSFRKSRPLATDS